MERSGRAAKPRKAASPRLPAEQGALPSLDRMLCSVTLLRETIPDASVYPFSIPAVMGLATLELHPRVTYFVGENGSGKSTLIEAIAVKAGFNAEGGSKNFRFATRRSESTLHEHLRLSRGARRPRSGFFLRAESYFNVGTEIERLDQSPGGGPPIVDAYGGVSVHEQSHGESFLRLIVNRFRPEGVYILDEPEAALSPNRQLSLLKVIDNLVREGAQFVIATHSPLVMAYPDAWIYRLESDGIRRVAYEETEHFLVTRDFLLNRESFLKHLLASPEVPPAPSGEVEPPAT